MLPAVRDIAEHQRYNDLTTLSIVGREGTGKSNLMAVLTHYLHLELSKLQAKKDAPNTVTDNAVSLARPYGVYWFGDAELADFENVLDSLPAKNRILVFDDVSFLSGFLGKKGMDGIKSVMTKIRHAKSGVDYRTVLGFNFHYSKGLDKYLRDVGFRFVTSMGAEELDNYADLFGHVNKPVLKNYRKVSVAFARGRSIKVRVGRGPHARALTYKYRDPFGLALYHDGLALRWLVYPGYDLVVPTRCENCLHPSEKRRKENIIMPDSQMMEIYEFLIRHCGSMNIVNQAARLLGFARYGRPMYVDGNNLKRALEIFRRLERDPSFSLDRFLSAIMPAKIPRGESGTIIPKWSTYIPTGIQEEYKKIFGVDALRPISET